LYTYVYKVYIHVYKLCCICKYRKFVNVYIKNQKTEPERKPKKKKCIYGLLVFNVYILYIYILYMFTKFVYACIKKRKKTKKKRKKKLKRNGKNPK
jgi:uncharacterized metal-binding protein